MKSIINRIHSCTDQWFSKLGYAIAVVTIAWPAQALATTGIGVLPWDAPLATIQGDLQGTVAHAATTIAVIGCGLTWSFSEHGTGARKMSAVALGGAAPRAAIAAPPAPVHPAVPKLRKY